MAAVQDLTEEEAYLVAILTDRSGIDLAEFCWRDEERDHGCFRLHDYQWRWLRNEATKQIDQCGRDLGKSLGITMRAFAFPFAYVGHEMCITAPELNHLRPLTDKVEFRLTSTRLASEMLPKNRGRGMARQPQWQVRFANGTAIISRLPNKDGKGVKGVHSTVLEMDEAQDFPLAGWVEIIESFKERSKGSMWRIHGVSRGVRDKFYEFSQEDSDFFVHRMMAMHRPDWSDKQRAGKVKQYGGSRQSTDYKRNIYGDHGDATNPVFVLARLMDRVDLDEGSEYNTEIYRTIRAASEDLGDLDIHQYLELRRPGGEHLTGNSLSKEGYSAFWAGMDVGLTIHPSEILLFGQRRGREDFSDLLLRLNLQRIDADDQVTAIDWLFEVYGERLRGFGIDRTGLGFPIYQILSKRPYGKRVHGYNFSEKVPVGIEDRKMEYGETIEDLVILRDAIEHATDYIRNEWVDGKRIQLPFDRELLSEWQGHNYVVIKSSGNAYGKRKYSEGTFHTLDAGRMVACVRSLPQIKALLDKPQQEDVLDIFPGAASGASRGSSESTSRPVTDIYQDFGML